MVLPQKHPRIPLAVEGIQVNHCKNPKCQNFGVYSLSEGSNKKEPDDIYVVIGARNQLRILSCRACKRNTVLRSNFAIIQEFDRLDPISRRQRMASCSTGDCSSFGHGVQKNPHLYFSHGKTKAGEPRYRCKACGATFTAGTTVRQQRRPEINDGVLKHLVNKVPMRRICEILNINPATLYSKIHYFAEAISHFSAMAEARLISGEVALQRAYVSVDRQDHFLNWGSQLDRRNTQLGAVGAVENASGYVLAMQMNFDPDCNPEEIEADAIERGDYDVPPTFRHYARLWLRRDYGLDTSKELGVIEDSAMDEGISGDLKPPRSGMQVKLETLYFGMFFHLKKLLRHVERKRFFLDLDPGLDSACLAAFVDGIKQREVDVFRVKVAKEATMSLKKSMISNANREFDRFVEAYTIPDGESARFHYVREHLKVFRTKNDSTQWFAYPLSDMADAGKEIQYLTDFGDIDLDHLTRLYMLTSLHGIDRFFMLVRRRLSVLERPIHTANNKSRVWYGYTAYSPVVAQNLLHILRGYYNYCLVGADKKTPAMRIGLAAQPVALADLVRSPRERLGR